MLPVTAAQVSVIAEPGVKKDPLAGAVLEEQPGTVGGLDGLGVLLFLLQVTRKSTTKDRATSSFKFRIASVWLFKIQFLRFWLPLFFIVGLSS